MSEQKLQVIPLGGLGEFGMNMTAIRYGEDIIVVDCGMMFPEAELLGVDLVMPDLTFLIENREHVRAVILTHGHEDHIGAVPYFLSEIDVPVYGTAFTLALVDRRLEEYDLEQEPRFIKVKPKQIVDIGPFKVEFIHVTHSIVSAVALAITTPLGVIIHTGDFKVDPTPTDNELFDLHTLADYGKRGVLLLMSDSTNADRPGYNHKHISVEQGDTVVLSSRIIPGNEKAIFRMIDHMSKRGADVLYGSTNPPLHVSGHGSVEEMKLVLNLVRPRYFMPIHGEFRQLTKHARLADHLRFAGLETTFVMESGEILEIDHHGARQAGKVQAGRVCIDSGSIDDVVQEVVIRDRRHLS